MGIFFRLLFKILSLAREKSERTFWPVGFLRDFVVPERPQASSVRGASWRSNCLKQLVLEKESDTQMEAG